MLSLLFIVFLEAALLAAIVVMREPKLLIPAVVALLPIEFFEVWGGAGGTGAAAAVAGLLFNPGQALMVVTVLVGAVRLRHDPGRLIPQSSLVVPILALAALMVLGVAWSDSTIPANSVLILSLYVAFAFIAPTLIEDRRDVERIVVALLATAIVLSLLAIVQRVGVFNWREILIQSDGVNYRSNATFSDPNILARFLAVAMALAAALILVTGPRRITLYLAVPVLAVGSVAIVATASRSGWLMLVFIVAAVVLLSPIAFYTKAKLVLAGGVGLTAMLTLLFAQGGAEAARVATLADTGQILGAREFLIAGGWEMFKDSPFVGVGAGNFQRSLLVVYNYVLPWWGTATLSHTSVITIMSELGIVGLFLFGFFAVRVAVTTGVTYVATNSVYNRTMVAWLAAALIGIFLQSQSEGRLFDEPFLWVLLAMVIAFETSPGLTGLARAERAPGVAIAAHPVAA